MYYFCTYFDQHYLARGLALIESLGRFCPSFRMWVLCLDDTCYDFLSRARLPSISLISIEDFEKGDEGLLRAKQNRTRLEYYFTCTPSLLLYVLQNHSEVDLVTYLDADLFFFSNPNPIYDEISDHSIAMVKHGFPTRLRHLERKHGIYNVSWVSIRGNVIGLRCLNWWREQCLVWCYDRSDGGRFADQEYLDGWPRLFQDVVVLRHSGVGLASWNLDNHRIHVHADDVWVDGRPLVFYHFHGLKQVNNWLFNSNVSVYNPRLCRTVRDGIYLPYVRLLVRLAQDFPGPLRKALRLPLARGGAPIAYATPLDSSAKFLVRVARESRNALRSLLAGDYVNVDRHSILAIPQRSLESTQDDPLLRT